jgi:hypothetical protein
VAYTPDDVALHGIQARWPSWLGLAQQLGTAAAVFDISSSGDYHCMAKDSRGSTAWDVALISSCFQVHPCNKLHKLTEALLL